MTNVRKMGQAAANGLAECAKTGKSYSQLKFALLHAFGC